MAYMSLSLTRYNKLVLKFVFAFNISGRSNLVFKTSFVRGSFGSVVTVKLVHSPKDTG